MKTFALILRILCLLPPFGSQPQDVAKPGRGGTATLVIASCTPGDTITVGPGNYRSFVPESGTVELKVPAQVDGDESYQIQDRGGVHRFNGIAYPNQMLTGVCS